MFLLFACQPEPSPEPVVTTPPSVDSGSTSDTATTADSTTEPTTPPTPMSGVDPSDPSLVVYFDFEETGAVATNRAEPGVYDGALTGTAIAQGPGGRFGQGLHLTRVVPEDPGDLVFDYTDEVIGPTDPRTVALWVRPDTTTPTIYEDGVITIVGEPDNAYCQIDYQGVAGPDGSMQVTVPVALPVGEWSYVACSTGPGAAQFAVFTPTETRFAADVYLGNVLPFPSSHLGRRLFGSVDELTVWAGERSLEQACADSGGAWVADEVRCALP